MLRVTIDLIPKGNERARKTLAEVEIVNDGTGTEERGNYLVRCGKWGKRVPLIQRGDPIRTVAACLKALREEED